jgi:hypothetical protein
MPFNPAPIAWLGAGYSLASSELKLKTATAAGTTVGGTVSANSSTNVLTTTSPHTLFTGAKVQFTQGTTLPTGIVAATNYFVVAVPTDSTFTISATSGGAVLDITADGTADNTVAIMAPLAELTDAEGNATTGDIRAVAHALAEALYQAWLIKPTADRPTRMNVIRSVQPVQDSNMVQYQYFITITATASVEVAPEP